MISFAKEARCSGINDFALVSAPWCITKMRPCAAVHMPCLSSTRAQVFLFQKRIVTTVIHWTGPIGNRQWRKSCSRDQGSCHFNIDIWSFYRGYERSLLWLLWMSAVCMFLCQWIASCATGYVWTKDIAQVKFGHFTIYVKENFLSAAAHGLGETRRTCRGRKLDPLKRNPACMLPPLWNINGKKLCCEWHDIQR